MIMMTIMMMMMIMMIIIAIIMMIRANFKIYIYRFNCSDHCGVGTILCMCDILPSFSI